LHHEVSTGRAAAMTFSASSAAKASTGWLNETAMLGPATRAMAGSNSSEARIMRVDLKRCGEL
jgi:hypothetical protein